MNVLSRNNYLSNGEVFDVIEKKGSKTFIKSRNNYLSNGEVFINIYIRGVRMKGLEITTSPMERFSKKYGIKN